MCVCVCVYLCRGASAPDAFGRFPPAPFEWRPRPPGDVKTWLE